MLKKTILMFFIIIFICISPALGAIQDNAILVPADNDVQLAFTGWGGVKLQLDEPANVYFSVYENGKWLKNAFNITEINEDGIYGNLSLLQGEYEEFSVLTGPDEIIVNQTEKSPFVTLRVYTFTKDDSSYAILEVRYPFAAYSSIGEDVASEPEIVFIPQKDSDDAKERNLTVNIVLIVIIVILLALIVWVIRKNKMKK